MSKLKFTRRRLEQYLTDAKSIKFLRRNPVIACELLLGIKLTDAQKWMLQESWNKEYVLWNCSRNFGKSFLGAIIIMLRALLYPMQKIYIVSSSGAQAQETYTKLEDIAKCNIASIDFHDEFTERNLDIFISEVVHSSNSDGFIHDKASFRITLFNGSQIFTLNSIPNNVRGKRANLVFLDESCFCDEELIVAVKPFLSQESEFKTSIKKGYDTKKNRKQMPTCLIWASSAGDIDHMHAKTYKEYSMRMLMGDNRYFVADMPCDITLKPMIDGEYSVPYLKQETIDNEMRINPEKAMREYYNKFQRDGGQNQIVKWATVRRNETLLLPKMCPDGNNQKFGIAYDPANVLDNSIVGVMEYIYDKEIGWYGHVCNFVNLVDLGKKKKMPMKQPDQIKVLKEMILTYNGKAKDYENIEMLNIDAGAGGGAVGISENMLGDWKDSNGIYHKGFIDTDFEKHKEEAKNFPNAWTGLNLISPAKWKSAMCLELIELMNQDLIKFPVEYNGRGHVNIERENGIEKRILSLEEEVALVNIDALKTELTSIHELRPNIYGLPKDKERKMHDDRFYVLLMLAHQLYRLREEDKLNRGRQTTSVDISQYFLYKG